VPPISWLASIPAALIVAFVRHLAFLPFATLWWPAGIVGTSLLAILGMSGVLMSKNKRPGLAKVLAASVVLVLLFVGGQGYFKSAKWPISDWQIVNCNVGQGDSLLVQSEGHFALIDVGRDDKPIRDCLDHLGINHLDLLVLTHFDADHVGGLSGALAGRRVDVGMLTDYPDERPQALAISDELRRSVSKIAFAFAGMTGSLGNIDWLVLQPEVHGVGSEDPNDGSITMRWDSATFTLFTMADLGEKGQMRLVQLHPSWIVPDHNKAVILKVSHHGSADQYPELLEAMRPDLSIISVGAGNPYGHPTSRTLGILNRIGSTILRTDKDGALSVAMNSSHHLSIQSGG